MRTTRLAGAVLAAALAIAPAIIHADETGATGAADRPTGADGGSLATTVFEATGAIAFEALEGENAHNVRGEEIGAITGVVMDEETGDLYVVVSAGGVLDIGDADIVFPYEDVAMIGGQVVVDTALSEDSLEERRNYESGRFVEVPEDEVIR